jgi:hypothetical protein
MVEFKDPGGDTQAAVIAVAIFGVAAPGAALLRWLVPPDPLEAGIADVADLIVGIAFAACAVLVLSWIYRTNANAHSFAGEMSVSPGWAVGWFFVPIANWFKPYQGVRETWDASHEAAGQPDEIGTPLLGWWWGLWLAFSIGNRVASRMLESSGGLDPSAVTIDLLVWLLALPLSLVLIRLMQRLSSAQRAAHRGGVFA